MRFHVEVLVRLKPGVLDPQGQQVAKVLRELGFGEVESVRVGRLIDLEVEAPDAASARAAGQAMADRLLVNPVLEVSDVVVA
jgi:phosphoribosylformylglycinamidine synthase PurS subunit